MLDFDSPPLPLEINVGKQNQGHVFYARMVLYFAAVSAGQSTLSTLTYWGEGGNSRGHYLQMFLYFAMTGTRTNDISTIMQLVNIIFLGIQGRKLTQNSLSTPTWNQTCFFANKGQTCFDGPMAQPQNKNLGETRFGRGYPNLFCISFATRRNMPEYAVGLLCLRVHIQTFGKNGTDVHTPIQTVIQTVGKNGTGVQTVES